MYVLARNNSLVALDATTGKEIWIHEDLQGIAPRGINYWESKDRSDRRLLFPMQQLSAGDRRADRQVDPDVRQERRGRSARGPRPRSGDHRRDAVDARPGKVFENLIILGSATGEDYMAPPGDIRAYDVVTGKLVWQFHTIPHPGEFGYETWPKDAWKYVGGANTWGEITVDRRARHRLLPDRLADLRLLRRRSARREPVRHLPARARRAHRQAALALPDGASRSLGLRQHGGAAADDRSGTTARRSTSSRRRARPASSTSSIA